MPTRLIATQTLEDDLRALKLFVRQQQMNWRAVQRNLEFIERQYLAYLDDFSRCGRYRNLQPHGVHARVLNKLYDQKPACLNYIDALRKRANKGLAVCPYCGLPGRLTLDHYLPRDVRAFPHFSVFSFNLVPACDSCQSIKSNVSPALRLRGMRATKRPPAFTPARNGRIAVNASARAQARHDQMAGRRKPERLLHPYFDKFLGNAIWKFVPTNVNAAFNSLALVALPFQGSESSLVRYHLRRLDMNVRALREIKHVSRFTIQSFIDRGIATPAAAIAEANILLNGELAKARTPNSVACTFLRAVRDVPALAIDLLQQSMQLAPALTLLSEGVRF